MHLAQPKASPEKNSIKQSRAMHSKSMKLPLEAKEVSGQCCTGSNRDAYQQAKRLNNTREETLGRMADDDDCQPQQIAEVIGA